MLESIFWKCLHSILGSYSSSKESTSDMSFFNYEASFPCLLNNDYFFALYFLRDKNCWELRLPWAKACYLTKTSPSDPWELAKLSSSLCAMLTQCTKSRTAACLQPEIASLQRPPTETSFFPLSPAINNKGVFGAPEHPHVSVLSSLSQSGFQNQAMLGTVENVPEILLKKSLLHFYFFCVGGTCWGGNMWHSENNFQGFLLIFHVGSWDWAQSGLTASNFVTHWGTELLDCGNTCRTPWIGKSSWTVKVVYFTLVKKKKKKKKKFGLTLATHMLKLEWHRDSMQGRHEIHHAFHILKSEKDF